MKHVIAPIAIALAASAAHAASPFEPVYDAIVAAGDGRVEVVSVGERGSTSKTGADCKVGQNRRCGAGSATLVYRGDAGHSLEDVIDMAEKACSRAGGKISSDSPPEGVPMARRTTREGLPDAASAHRKALGRVGYRGICEGPGEDALSIVIKRAITSASALSGSGDDLDDDSYTIYINDIQQNNG